MILVRVTPRLWPAMQATHSLKPSNPTKSPSSPPDCIPPSVRVRLSVAPLFTAALAPSAYSYNTKPLDFATLLTLPYPKCPRRGLVVDGGVDIFALSLSRQGQVVGPLCHFPYLHR